MSTNYQSMQKLADLSTKDSLDYETLEWFGGVGEDYAGFFDDFDDLVYISGTVPANTYCRPKFGQLSGAGTGTVCRVDINGQSGMSLYNPPTNCGLNVYGLLNGITDRKWRLSVRGSIYKGAATTLGAYIALNYSSGIIGFGIDAGNGLTSLVFGKGAPLGWTAPNAIVLGTADSNKHQIDMRSLGDGIVQCRLDGGAWASLALTNVSGQHEMLMSSATNHMIWLDWLYWKAAREP